MKYILLSVILVLVSVSSLFSIVYETDSFSQFIYGTAENCEYDDWVSHVSKGVAVANYNLYAPFYRQTNGFGDFRIATTQELNNWNQVVMEFINGNYTQAQNLINTFSFPYNVVQFTDTDTDRVYYMLREILNMDYFDDQGTPETTDDVHGSFDYGWGLYVVWPDAPQPIIVNVVHPNDDFITPPLAVKAFQDWDAKYLMIAGAGREVKWTNVPPFWNSKSLSDPSRVSAHPFNRFYNAACNEIRETFNRREFSAQLHSYDWNRHEGHANLQISAGPGTLHPNLPIRDLSSRRMDLINQTDYLVIPENTIGIHEPVYTNDYYAVYYNPAEEPFYFDNGEISFPVNNMISLPGFAQNVQFLYTNAGQNRFDVVDHFFHIEFDELPNAYPQNENNYFWFYGYDLTTNTFDMSRRFDRTLEYYGLFIDLMKPVLFEALALNDNLVPDMPENFRMLSKEYSKITVAWDTIDQYDFNTYEIHYSTTPNSQNADIHDRTVVANLASANTGFTTIQNLQAGSTYYLKIRAKDYNGNYSDFSEEIVVPLGPANISAFVCRSIDATSYLSWSGTFQSNLHGYRIYRAEEGQDYVMIADWNTNPELLKTSNTQSFNFIDESVENFVNYYYKIAMVDINQLESMYYEVGFSSPRPTHRIILENTAGTIQDEVFVGNSPFATDGQDTFYDVVKSGTPPAQFVQIMTFQQTWNNNNGVSLSREIFGEYDTTTDFKQYRIRVRSNQNNLRIRLDNTHRATEKLILLDVTANQFVDLHEQDYTFSVTNSNFKEFRLIVGNVQPVVSFSGALNRIYQAGDNLNFSLTTTYHSLLDHYKVSIQSDSDSLLVNNNLQYTTANQTFTIPDNITMHNANLIVDAYCTDGEIIRYVSPWKLGIVPAQIEVSFNEGNNFISNPFTASPFNINNLVNGAEMFTFMMDEWAGINDFAFGSGYFLNSPTSFSQEYSHIVQKGFYNKILAKGWNLVPNPHVRDFNIKDIDFSLNNEFYTYAELYQLNALMPYVRVIRNGVYEETDTVLAGESFFIYANIRDTDNLSAQFTPYKNNLPLSSNHYVWDVKLIAESVADRKFIDEIYLSSSKNADLNHISLNFIQPEPIALPDNFSFYLRENTNNNAMFNRLTSGILSDSEPDYISYPFTLELNEIQTIKFYANYLFTSLPYQVVLVIDDNEVHFTENTVLTYNPQSTTITGYVKIVNEFLSNETELVATPMSMSVYPNPFNPTTNIAFNLSKSTHVDVSVYNIKGQKVKTLNNNVLSSGNHVISWNGTDSNNKMCASGIYFVSINAQGFNRQIKKISLIK